MIGAPDESHESDPSFLIGTWAIDRTIVNRATATHGKFLGTLNVTRDGDRFNWHEAGKLVWNARELPATRALWQLHRSSSTKQNRSDVALSHSRRDSKESIDSR